MAQITSTSDKISLRPGTDQVRRSFLKCGECTREFNNYDRKPNVMSCLHSYCDQCTMTLISRDKVKCPDCNECTELSNEKLEHFRKDGSREYLINYFQVQSNDSNILCEECVMKMPAICRCRECSQFLCDECMHAHRRTKLTKSHNVIRIDELRGADLEDFQRRPTCDISGHEGQPFAFFCFSKSCDKPICAVCVVRDHHESKGHNIRVIGDVFSEIRREIEELMSGVKHRQLAVNDAITSVEETLKKLEVCQTRIGDEIDTVFDTYKKIIGQRRKYLKNKLTEIIKAKRRRLASQLNALTNQKSNMEDANEFAGYISKFATPPECLDFKDMVKRRLRLLTEMPFDVAPHDNALIRFQKHRLENVFQEFLHSCGDVWYTSTYVPNTKIVTHDLNIHEKGVAMTITLFNQEGDIQKQGAVDVEAEVVHPDGTKSQPLVEDFTGTDGCYKLHFVGNQLGRHHCNIYVLGKVVNPDGFSFQIVSGRADTVATYDNKRMQSASTSTTGGGDRSEAPGVDPVLGDVVCPEFMFDASISHASIEISDDAKSMKAKHIKRAVGSYRSKESGKLVNYRGTMANVPLYKTGLYYFEISIQYKVLRLIRQTMVFEVGLARLDVIDKHYSVDCYPYAWAVSARGCHVCGKVCLQTWHNGQLLSHSALSPRTPNPPGTVVRTHYGFLLDTTKRHWIVVDVKSNKLVFHFKNLVVSELSDPLWPIFGIYNPDHVSVTFQLITGSDIKFIPEAAIDAITL